MLLANTRTPVERAGDLDAQVGANVVGVERLAALVAAGAPVDEVLAYGERRMRAALGALPDGTWRFDRRARLERRPTPTSSTRCASSCRSPSRGDELTFDFTGTDPQQPGNVNAVEAVTVSAVAFAVRAVIDPTIPANGGALRPVHVVAPPGTVVAAELAGGGGGRQRRGQPAGRRRLPRRAGPGRCPAGWARPARGR